MSADQTLPGLWPDDSPRVRKSDRLTSHAAADANDVAGSQSAVLTVLSGAKKPLADFEIEQVHRLYVYKPYSSSRLRTARKELEADGVVVAVSQTRSPLGNRTTTWALAPTKEDP